MGRQRNTGQRRALAALASRQHGVVSRSQLRRLGVSRDEIRRAVESGRLHRVFRAVYAVGHVSIGVKGTLMAAVLACGSGAVISHRSAAALLGFLDEGPVVIDVIAPPERGRKIDGIRFHRVRPPRPQEQGTVARIPCTSPARTMVDLAGTVGTRTLRSCFERAAQRRELDIGAIEASLEPRRRGEKALRALIDEWRLAATVSTERCLKSPLEAKVLPLVLARGFSAPLANAPVQLATARIEVDFLWPECCFVLEADSRDFHGTAIAFERDRWRDRELLAAGYTSLRVTSLQAETEAESIAHAIAARLH
ncbi:MAG TPA: type IV toxin-antitoxin system AbiEi family antitoxin domain-containing protein [Solirubrobacterales bacterium]|nr:type IV toxin-antitoxin system AbiEi family antitoxin domain-containing protein [Solirubrobacterales bacterium]